MIYSVLLIWPIQFKPAVNTFLGGLRCVKTNQINLNKSRCSVESVGGRSLRLMHASVEDAGRYTCIVTNSAGEEKKTFDIDVLGKVIL